MPKLSLTVINCHYLLLYKYFSLYVVLPLFWKQHFTLLTILNDAKRSYLPNARTTWHKRHAEDLTLYFVSEPSSVRV